MSATEVQHEFQHENSPSGQHAHGAQLQEAVGGRTETGCKTNFPNSGQADVDMYMMSADVALAPHPGHPVDYSCDCKACSCLKGRRLQSMQLQFFLDKADDLQDCLINGQSDVDKEALAASVPSLLFTCQPYFNYLESTARSTGPHHIPLATDRYTRLLGFSQQLCDKLEQLVLTYVRYNLLCVDETKPDSLSPICIGKFQLGHLRLSTFRYCKPMPYLSQFDTGLFKRMRWNVERLQHERQTDDGQGGEDDERQAKTEYYFLCYEEIPKTHAEIAGGSHSSSHCNIEQMWSIGLWVQVDPDPNTEDIYKWILCEVPQGTYHKLLFLGSVEPSIWRATDCLQQLLLQQTTN